MALLGGACSTAEEVVRASMGWAESLQQVLTQRPETLPARGLAGLDKTSGFVATVEPLIIPAVRRLQAGAEALAGGGVPWQASAVAEILLPNLTRRLADMLSRTMVLELNVARLRGDLRGESAEERFKSFLGKLAEPACVLNLMREYPVLARQVMERIDQWVRFSLEFLLHLRDGWEEIQARFFPEGKPGMLAEARAGMGDHHREGRSVLWCRFTSGRRLIYKPRSLALDVHFQELLRWVNERGSHPPLRVLNILSRGDHGWVEFIEAGACGTADDANRFYQRQGANLALLYALEACDFHHENVIAAGEHPVLVDVEALFHARIQEEAEDELEGSVMRAGLLPHREFGDGGSEGIDLSGMGAGRGQVTPYAVPAVRSGGTDEMRFVREYLPVSFEKNRPLLAGAQLNPQDYGDAIVHGFTSMYQTLIAHRDALLAADGPLQRFHDDEIRVLLRSTEVYGLLLWDSFHPDMLRDALDRDRLLDRLWLAVRELPLLEQVISSERRDLLSADMPIFTARVSSRDLSDSRGRRYAGFFPQTGMDRAKKRLVEFNEDNLDRQIWFIRASLASLVAGEPAVTISECEPPVASGTATPKRLEEEALRIGERLQKLAMRGRNGATWVGVGLVNDRAWSILPLGPALYDGVPGVALFLAYLGAHTGRDEFEELARLSLGPLRNQWKALPEDFPVGAYSGLGGMIYMLCHLSALWEEEGLLDEAENIVRDLPAKIQKDPCLDLMGGAAGCLAALNSLYRLRPSDEVLCTMLQCGEHLLRQAQPMEQGIGWLVKAVASRPLTGFSHGASGIAWALMQLAALTGDDRFRAAALQGLAYERSQFAGEAGNWLDLRPAASSEAVPRAQRCGTTWCHGAPGIALARLKMLEHVDDGELRAEAVTALRTTLARSFGLGHCLCHGDLGNLEPLLQAGLLWDEAEWKTAAGSAAAAVLAGMAEKGWLCGTQSHVETPGLMTGLAGMGYQLLRLARPERMPSVLCLQPPVAMARSFPAPRHHDPAQIIS
jgi:type 2 lantibiotic biosynthesis protein LanM